MTKLKLLAGKALSSTYFVCAQTWTQYMEFHDQHFNFYFSWRLKKCWSWENTFTTII